jgi:glycosyltransferase involved in cell wall biosynthesis
VVGRPSCKAAPILLDRWGWETLLAERWDRAEGRPVPLRWFGLLDDLSRGLSGETAQRWSPRDLVSARGQLVAWLPSSAAIATAIRGGPLSYLCWGVPDYVGAKTFLFMTLLSRATHLLVNDEVTRDEIKVQTGRTAALVPYFVDTEFFAYRGLEERGDFIFCNGSNGRDPSMLAGLAERGHDVAWLCNDPVLREAFRSRHPRLKLCSRLSYEELRRLYQTCAAVITPVGSDTHAAGQTTGLEALSCGAPLLISQCRAATIFAGLPSAYIVSSDDSEQWSTKVASLARRNGALSDETYKSAELIRQRHSGVALSEALRRVYETASRECLAPIEGNSE